MTETMSIHEMENYKWQLMLRGTFEDALNALYVQDCIDQCMTQSYNLMFEYLNEEECNSQQT